MDPQAEKGPRNTDHKNAASMVNHTSTKTASTIGQYVSNANVRVTVRLSAEAPRETKDQGMDLLKAPGNKIIIKPG